MSDEISIAKSHMSINMNTDMDVDIDMDMDMVMDMDMNNDTAGPAVAGRTEPGTVATGVADGAGTAPRPLADGAHEGGEVPTEM
jgi:hypothetical protein